MKNKLKLSTDVKYEHKHGHLLGYDTDIIIVPVITCILCAYLIMIINHIEYLFFFILLNILLTWLFITYIIMTLKTDFSLLKWYLISIIHGEFSESQTIVIRTHNLRNTPTALFSPFIEIFCYYLLWILIIFWFILYACIYNLSSDDVEDWDQIFLLFYIFILLVGLVKAIWTIYLILIRPKNTLQSNIGSILNNAFIVIFAVLIAFMIPIFDDEKLVPKTLSTSYFFLFLIPYDQIIWFLDYWYKRWAKHLNCCKKDNESTRLKEFENRLINNSSSNISRLTSKTTNK